MRKRLSYRGLALVFFFLFFFPGTGVCSWDKVSQLATYKIKETPGLDELPELVLERSAGKKFVLNALRRNLTEHGYRVAHAGPFPRVEVVRNYRKTSRFWEKPYQAYVLELRITEKDKIIRQMRVPYVESVESPYQLPIRVFIAIIVAVFLYGFMVALSLHKSLKVWLVFGFAWIVLAAFLAQGYYLPEFLF